MTFRITALPSRSFEPLFELGDEGLAERGIHRVIADAKPGYPCRVSMRDAEPGEELLLMNFEHQPAASPFRSSHAIFVRVGAREERLDSGVVPEMLRTRTLSVRAFDDNGMMKDAELVAGADLEPVIERLLATPGVAYLHLHSALPGCYLGRVDRA